MILPIIPGEKRRTRSRLRKAVGCTSTTFQSRSRATRKLT